MEVYLPSEEGCEENITGEHHHLQHKLELGARALDCHDQEEEEEKEVIEPPKQCSEERKLPPAKLLFYTILIFVSYTTYVNTNSNFRR